VLLTVVLSTLGFTSHSRPGALWRAEIAVALGPAALSLIQRYFQRPMLVAVTRQQVVVTRRTAFRDPRRHVVVTRASDAMITAGRRTRWTTTIVLATQGTGPLQLNAIRRQRAELDHVLAAAQSAGVAISASAAINDSATGTPTVLPLPPTRA